MNKTKTACILTVTILFIVFVVQNTGSSVTVKFLFFHWYIPNPLLICVSVLIGVVLGLLACMRK
jgi:uncharacterized integral membrane protein